MNNNILITGGLGFIGSYLAKHLTKIGYTVSVIDNEFRWSLNSQNNSLNELGINVTIGDINDKKLIDELVAINPIVIHLAGVSQVITSINHPEICYKHNILGTQTVVDACKNHHSRIIFSSSREIYGSQSVLPVKVGGNYSPENPYGASKVFGECLIRAYGKSYGLKYSILRFSNVYGAGDKDRVIPIFIDRARKNQNITIYGNSKIIDFINIFDAVDAIHKVLELNDSCSIFNIGSGIPETLLNLAQLIKTLTLSNSEIAVFAERNGEVDQFFADIAETREKIGWNPTISLGDGIKAIIGSELEIHPNVAGY